MTGKLWHGGNNQNVSNGPKKMAGAWKVSVNSMGKPEGHLRRNCLWDDLRFWKTETYELLSRKIVQSGRLIILAALVYAGVGVTASIAEIINPAAIYVIDGDTIDLNGQRFRLVGLDTPETYRAKCAYEKALGDAATQRMRNLVGSGLPLNLVVLPGRDKYQRGLARLYIGQVNAADILISENLARPYEGGKRQGWCG